MPRNNIKLLTDSQRNELNDKYKFEFDENDVIVKFDDYARVTRHSRQEPFFINAKHIRKVHFSKEAIDIWISLCEQSKTGKMKYTLIDVQHAANLLTITYRKPTIESVKKILSSNSTKIKNI